MKRFFAVILSAVMLCGMLLPALAYADDENNAQEFSIENLLEDGVNITSDLDGDGQEDNISITETYVEWHLYQTNIKINDKDYTMDADPSWIGQIYLIDLNKDDKTKELLISEAYHGRSVYAIIRYENNNITPLNIFRDSERGIFTQAKEELGELSTIYSSGNGVLKIGGMNTLKNSEHVYTEDRYKETTRGTLVKLDENVTPWETGEYEEIVAVGDYIYYAGPYYLDDGRVDGIYGLRMYNTKTREDIAIINRLCRIDVIGDKIFVIGGDISSGSWSRILVVFNVGSDEGTRIASGIDMNFSMTDTPYSIYNNRIYIGHQADMEHYEIISFTLDGTDVRVEVPPVETKTLYSDIYETYAVIDDVIYDYQYIIDNRITVFLNNNEIKFDQQPIIYNERTLVPLRAIFEALGATVSWDDNTRTVTAVKDEVTVKFTINAYQFYKNGEAVDLDVPSMIVNDRTLVPVRAISEAFGSIVDWDGDSQQVIIRSNS